MTEHGRDCFEAHAPVDRLGRERVSELVEVNVTEPGVAGDAFDDPADVVTVESPAVAVQEVSAGGWMGGDPVGEESFGVRMEWDVAVVVEFPDRDPQPRCRVQCDDRTVSWATEHAVDIEIENSTLGTSDKPLPPTGSKTYTISCNETNEQIYVFANKTVDAFTIYRIVTVLELH